MVGAEPSPRRLEVELSYATNPLVDGKTPEQIDRIRRVLTGDSATSISPARRGGQNGSKPEEADDGTAADDDAATADTGEADDESRTRSASLGTELSRIRTLHASRYHARSACVRWLAEEGLPGVVALVVLILLFLYLAVLLVIHVTSVADILVGEEDALTYIGVSAGSKVAVGILVSILLLRLGYQMCNLTCRRHKLHKKAIKYVNTLPSKGKTRIRSRISTGSMVVHAPIIMTKKLYRIYQWQRVSIVGANGHIGEPTFLMFRVSVHQSLRLL